MPKLTFVLALALSMLAFGAGAQENAVLIELPPARLPRDISSNAMVVGGLRSGGGFYWLPTTGVIYVGGQTAEAVSRGGETIAGIAYDARNVTQAAIWQRAAEWRLLGSVVPNAVPCDDLLSSTYDTSDDGKVIVGLAWNGCNFARAFRWEESTGMVDLGSTVAQRSSRANGVSGDGRVVVGWQEVQPVRGTARDGLTASRNFSRGRRSIIGEAHAANRDGSVIVGQACEFVVVPESLRQSASVDLDQPRRRDVPAAAAREGPPKLHRHCAGHQRRRARRRRRSVALVSKPKSVIWIDREPAYLKDYLRANGVPDAFQGWVNTGFVTGVSRDGRILVGYGAGPRDFQGFIVMLPNGARP